MKSLLLLLVLLTQCNGFIVHHARRMMSRHLESYSRNTDNTNHNEYITTRQRSDMSLHCSSQDITNIIEVDAFAKITTSADSSVILPSIIDFQKSKCKPCQRVAPEYERLAEKYRGVANFFKVDADSSPEAIKIMKEQGVRSVPTFQLWFKGSMVDSIQGAHMDELESSLKNLLDKK